MNEKIQNDQRRYRFKKIELKTNIGAESIGEYIITFVIFYYPAILSIFVAISVG